MVSCAAGVKLTPHITGHNWILPKWYEAKQRTHNWRQCKIKDGDAGGGVNSWPGGTPQPCACHGGRSSRRRPLSPSLDSYLGFRRRCVDVDSRPEEEDGWNQRDRRDSFAYTQRNVCGPAHKTHGSACCSLTTLYVLYKFNFNLLLQTQIW